MNVYKACHTETGLLLLRSLRMKTQRSYLVDTVILEILLIDRIVEQLFSN